MFLILVAIHKLIDKCKCHNYVHKHYSSLVLAMTYRILVIAEGKHFGLSTSCLYVNVGGEYRETGVTEIPRGEYQIEVQVGESRSL